jgi:hypothetical protein
VGQTLVALISTEARSFIVHRLKPFVAILQNIYPSLFEPVDSSGQGFKFKNIQLDVYNRFAENVSDQLILYLKQPLNALRVTTLQKISIPTFSRKKVLEESTTDSVFHMLLKLFEIRLKRIRLLCLLFKMSVLSSAPSSRNTYQTPIHISRFSATYSL